MRIVFGLLLLGACLAAFAALVAYLVRLIANDRTHGTSGTLSSAALEMQSILEPSKRTVLEAKRQSEEREDEDDSGEP